MNGWNHPHEIVFDVANNALPDRVRMGLDSKACGKGDQLAVRDKRGVSDQGKKAAIPIRFKYDPARAGRLPFASRG
jgi:hypothetical protein